MQKSGQSQSYQSQSMPPVQQKCFKCGLTRGTNHVCPAIGQTFHKCGNSGHFISMCGKFKFRSSGPPQCQMNELNWNQGSQPQSHSRSHNKNSNQTIPKQAVEL